MYLTQKNQSLLVSVNKSDFSPYFDIIEKKNKYFELCKKLKKNICQTTSKTCL